jgi:hypothetical protein
MMQTIRTAEPLPESRIRLTWGDGSKSVLGLSPILAKGGVFAFLTDPAAFNAVEVGERDRTLVWRDPDGDEVDLCADALSRMAHGGEAAAATQLSCGEPTPKPAPTQK